jgi:hypothetical protein
MTRQKSSRARWGRKSPTGFTRPKRISIRARKRLYKKLLDAKLAEQLFAGAKSLVDDTRTEV